MFKHHILFGYFLYFFLFTQANHKKDEWNGTGSSWMEFGGRVRRSLAALLGGWCPENKPYIFTSVSFFFVIDSFLWHWLKHAAFCFLFYVHELIYDNFKGFSFKLLGFFASLLQTLGHVTWIPLKIYYFSFLIEQNWTNLGGNFQKHPLNRFVLH